VRILQKSKENGQNRTITDMGMEEHTKSQKNAIKKLYVSKLCDWPLPKGNDTRGLKKAHKEWGFYTRTYGKEAQRPLTHGLPRWQSV
ncbi:hypothetical protein Tco_1573251, partial [Tanacetum coccineum]